MTAASAAPSAEKSSIDPFERIRLLKELAALKADGILTEEEFLAEKKKLLGN